MEAITSFDQLDLNKLYTYADYFSWKFEEKIELIKGKVFKMSPAPSRIHQGVSWNLAREVDKVLHRTGCKMYAAPFDVRLVDFKKSTEDAAITSVVQPDISVICDESKLDDRGCIGSPDLIVEILSPGNSKKEMSIKFDLYQENGVREYWIVEPYQKTILLYSLVDGKYIGLKPFTEDDTMQSVIFPELTFGVGEIFS